MADKIKLRRDTLANWEAVNPILDEGEFGWISDKFKGKIGDGVTGFNDLRLAFNTPESWINVKDFGAKGDGITNDVSAIQSAINSLEDGQILYFPEGIYNVPSTGFNIEDKHNILIMGPGTIQGTSPEGFKIRSGSDHITFRDLTFRDLGQVIWLWECENITVSNCTFDHTGYGIIQQVGYVSNNVLIDGCIAQNMRDDFVEANCTSSALSKNWIITNNRYLGNEGYPNVGSEDRFVGITAVENVIISNNLIEKAAGDSAIHLEATGGEIIISNNIFDNILGYGYIAVWNGAKHCVISNNIFRRTDTSIGIGDVLEIEAESYSTRILFEGNRVIGTNKNLIMNLFRQQNLSIKNNIFEDIEGLLLIGLVFFDITNNEFINCQRPIAYSNTNGNAARYGQIALNYFRDTVEENCIELRRSSNNGTGPSHHLLIFGNFCDKGINIYDSNDIKAFGNMVGENYDVNVNHYYHNTTFPYNNLHDFNFKQNSPFIYKFGYKEIYGNAPGSFNQQFNVNDKIITTNPNANGCEGWICTEAGSDKRTTGDLTAGSNTITNVAAPTIWVVGEIIKADGIPAGTTITAIDTTAKTITISNAATTTSTGVLLYQANFKKFGLLEA